MEVQLGVLQTKMTLTSPHQGLRLTSVRSSSLSNPRAKPSREGSSCSLLYSRRWTLSNPSSSRMDKQLVAFPFRLRTVQQWSRREPMWISRLSKSSILHLSPISTTTCVRTSSRSTVSTLPLYSWFCILIESTMRVFNSYLQLCSLSYWGPSGGPAGPRMGSKSANYFDNENG